MPSYSQWPIASVGLYKTFTLIFTKLGPNCLYGMDELLTLLTIVFPINGSCAILSVCVTACELSMFNSIPRIVLVVLFF